MSTPQLTSYIATERTKGLSDEAIRQNLLKAGWQEDTIKQVLTPNQPHQSIVHQSISPIKIIVSIILFLLIGVVGYFSYQYWQINLIQSYDACVNAPGSTIDANESGHSCITKDNKKFTQALSINEKKGLMNSNLDLIRGGLEIYFSDNKRYPDSLEQLVPQILSTMHLNPLTNTPYSYAVNANKSDYTITATLEDGTVYTVGAPK